MSPLTTAYHHRGHQRHDAALAGVRAVRVETVEKTFYETNLATLHRCFHTKTRNLSCILSVD
jgi:hypothetical protein